MTHYYLEEEGGGGTGSSSSRVIEVSDAPVVVGRNDIGAKDKKCSRKQVSVVLEAAASDSTTTATAASSSPSFKVTAHGVNPSLVTRQDGSLAILRAGESARLRVGDKVALLCNGAYSFILTKRDKPLEGVVSAQENKSEHRSNNNNNSGDEKCQAKWSWLDDGGWVQYPAPVAEKLEATFQAKDKECPVDAERFVDLDAMAQKRRDNPTKWRKVKREEARKPVTVVHFAQQKDVVVALGKIEGVQLSPTMSSAVTHVVAPMTAAGQKEQALFLSGAKSHGAVVVTYEWASACVCAGCVLDAKAYLFTVPKGVKAPLADHSQSPPQQQQKKKKKEVPAASGEGGGGPTQAVRVRPDEYVVWMWRKDDGEYQEYSQKVSDKIEQAYQITGPDAPETVDIGGKWYVDLRTRTQRAHGIDDIERQLMRETRKK